MKTVWDWHTDRLTDQWNKLDSPEKDPYIYGQLISDKVLKASRQGQFFFQKGVLKQPDIHMQKEPEPPLLSHIIYKNHLKMN